MDRATYRVILECGPAVAGSPLSKLATGRAWREDHDALVKAIRHGDILLFNGWYHSDEGEKIKKLYEEATQGSEIRSRKSAVDSRDRDCANRIS